MDVLDLVEHESVAASDALARVIARREGLVLHPGLVRWVRHATVKYLAAADRLTVEGTPLRPVLHPWVYQWRSPDDAETYEICAWGRRYASPDGCLRELRLPVLDSVDGRPERAAAEVAVAAFVIAYGQPAEVADGWSQPFRLLPGQPVSRVRVVEVGCSDGSVRVAFDGDPSRAQALYAEHGRAKLRAVVQGGAYRPGWNCDGCKLVTACPALPRVPGLLGIHDTSRPRRTWTVTTGRRYRRCPAQEYLRRLHLPRDADMEYSPQVVRGKAVHAWLAEAHGRQPLQPCDPANVPATLDAWKVGEWEISEDEARLAVRQLLQHASVCPLHHLESGAQVRVEPTVVVHDTEADVVIIAQPDLLYQDAGSWVWRETKTTRRARDMPESDLLVEYPQVALAVVLLNDNTFGGNPMGFRVELERLGPDSALIDLIEPGSPQTVARAREVLRDLAMEWHQDTVFPTRPGPHCRTCEVSWWCPDADLSEAAVEIEQDDE